MKPSNIVDEVHPLASFPTENAGPKSPRLDGREEPQEPFTLGVRLDVDFDGFFRRDDAGEQLKIWREASGGCSGATILGILKTTRCYGHVWFGNPVSGPFIIKPDLIRFTAIRTWIFVKVDGGNHAWVDVHTNSKCIYSSIRKKTSNI